MVNHVVFVSGGKDSTAMALRLAEVQPEIPWRYVCTPTGNELPDVVEHWALLETILGRPIERIAHPDGLGGLIDKQQMLPAHHSRWCTRMLKIVPAIAWAARNAPCIAYVGLRADEPTRHGVLGSRMEQRHPLREWGWGINEVKAFLLQRGIKVPARTDCAWCYDQRLSDWYELKLRYPAIWLQAVEKERETGHTFRSPARDTWPTDLQSLGEKFDAGYIPPRVQINGDLFDEPERCRMCSL